MSAEFRFLGTGDVRQVPVFGCQCSACERARNNPKYRRKPCSAEIRIPEENITVLIDAGLVDLAERYRPGELSAILLTHYHVDHVQGLFHFRWGLGESIPVLGPDDQNGCADLTKHSGILDFQPALAAFQPINVGSLRITPIPLQHSKPTYGYLFQKGDLSFAYLTDTVGLPEKSMVFLKSIHNLSIAIDCSHPPQESVPRNHNDLNQVYEIINELKPIKTWITHISHEMDEWVIKNTLKSNVLVARDNIRFELSDSQADPHL